MDVGFTRVPFVLWPNKLSLYHRRWKHERNKTPSKQTHCCNMYKYNYAHDEYVMNLKTVTHIIEAAMIIV